MAPWRRLHGSAHAMIAALLLASFRASLGKRFQPFAAVQELQPHGLAEFCGERHPATGLARCERAVRKKLDDGGDLEFTWRMHVDPEKILSLDLEADAKAPRVRLLRCGPTDLLVEVAGNHSGLLEPGMLIVASRFAHECPHLEGASMFHRVLEVSSSSEEVTRGRVEEHRNRSQQVHLLTKQLPDLAHAVPSCSFNFSYSPVEARDKVPFPALRTDFGQGHASGRRMQSPAVESIEALLTHMPKKISNFGWNWDFLMNTTENPEFMLSAPGIDGFMRLKQPYIKVHAALYLNFSSHFEQLTQPPKVTWKMGLNAHGAVNARMMTDIKSTSEVAEDPFHLFEIPVLEKLKTTTWFGMMDFSAGTMPFTVEPGFQFTAKMYHTGMFDGTLQLGGKTSFVINPELIFDSETGLVSSMKSDFKDTDLYPPLWIISTKHFEMGVALEPTVWLRGQFVGSSNSKLGFAVRPYLNLTITRNEDGIHGTDMKDLLIYPIRVIGLNTFEFNKKYSVRVSFHGKDYTTSPELNYGQVEFHDHVSSFNVGSIPLQSLLNDPIKVTLLELQETTFETAATELGTALVDCNAVSAGRCQPSPSIAEIDVNGHVVGIEMAILWQEDPVPWFASQLRGLSLSFPRIQVRGGICQRTGHKTDKSVDEEISLRVTQAGRTFVIPITRTQNDCQGCLQGAQMLELGPVFLNSWAPCHSLVCSSTLVEILCGSEKLAASEFPEALLNTIANAEPQAQLNNSNQQLDSELKAILNGNSSNEEKDKQFGGALNTLVMNAIKMTDTSSTTTKAPFRVPPPKVFGASIAFSGVDGIEISKIDVQVVVANLAQASAFLEPAHPGQVHLSEKRSFAWTVANATLASSYKFKVSILRAPASPSVSPTLSTMYPSIGGEFFEPVTGTETIITAVCQKHVSTGNDMEVRPCSFEYLVDVAPKYFAVHNHLVLRVEWNDNNQDHVMSSPPVEVAPGSSGSLFGGRLLRSSSSRRLWTQEDWDERLAANRDSCRENDLHFEVGFGCMERVRVVGAAAALIPALQSQVPEINTDYHGIGRENLMDADAARLLPDFLCSDGVCKGRMPGCTQASFKIMHFPELVFNFNREFKYADMPSGGQTIKQIFAYAFSTMPQAIEVLIQRLNNGTTTQSPVLSSTTVHKQPKFVAPVEGTAVDWTGMPIRTTTVNPFASQAAWGASADDWASRRLRSPDTVGEDSGDLANDSIFSPADSALQGQQVVVRFKQGVRYRIDRPLIDMMRRHGMFQDFEDDLSHELGAVFITDFDVRGGEPAVFGRADPLSGQETFVVATVVVLSAAVAVCGYVLKHIAAAGSKKQYIRVECQELHTMDSCVPSSASNYRT